MRYRHRLLTNRLPRNSAISTYVEVDRVTIFLTRTAYKAGEARGSRSGGPQRVVDLGERHGGGA